MSPIFVVNETMALVCLPSVLLALGVLFYHFANFSGKKAFGSSLFLFSQVVLNLGTLQNSHEGRISCLGLSSDGSALCTGSWDKNLKVPFYPAC